MRRWVGALALGLALSSVAQAQERWWEMEPQVLQRRGESLVARDSGSSEGWNLIGVGHLFNLEQPSDKAGSFLRSYRARPNQEAAVYLAQIALEKRNFRSATEWAIKALSFPSPSLHALEYFETATSGEPDLSHLATRRVEEVKAHRLRWLGKVQVYRDKLRVAQVSVTSQVRLPADEGRVFTLNRGQLVATSSSGRELWRAEAGVSQSKLVATGPRVFAIGPETVKVYDAADGSAIASWPSHVVLGHVPEWEEYGVDGKLTKQSSWNAWENPEWLSGADTTAFYLNHGRWLCVLRQKDAGGWARYFQREVNIAQVTPKLLVLGVNAGEVEVRDARAGELRWAFQPRMSGEARLLGYSDEEVVVGLLNLGQIAGFSTSSGKLLWTKSHLEEGS